MKNKVLFFAFACGLFSFSAVSQAWDEIPKKADFDLKKLNGSYSGTCTRYNEIQGKGTTTQYEGKITVAYRPSKYDASKYVLDLKMKGDYDSSQEFDRLNAGVGKEKRCDVREKEGRHIYEYETRTHRSGIVDYRKSMNCLGFQNAQEQTVISLQDDGSLTYTNHADTKKEGFDFRINCSYKRDPETPSTTAKPVAESDKTSGSD